MRYDGPTSSDSPSSNVEFALGSWTTKLFVLLLFAILSVGMTYPLILNLRTAVPAHHGIILSGYTTSGVSTQHRDLQQGLTINPTIFYPFAYDLRLSDDAGHQAPSCSFLFWGDEILANTPCCCSALC
jgi:hypothetical protein